MKKPYHQSLKFFHTFKINVFAKNIIIVKTIEKLINIWKKCKKYNLPFLILGEGSNIIFNNNYRGIVVINQITGITICETSDYWSLHVKGGVKWHKLVKYTIKRGIYGLENLALIPGSVGAAPIQNIGAYGVEFKDICQYVDILFLNNLKITRINVENCLFSYRNSIFNRQRNLHYIIYAVGIKLPKAWNPITSYLNLTTCNFKNITAHKIFHHISKLRKTKIPNPKKIGNAGSFFKNPIINKQQAYNLMYKYRTLPYFLQNNGMIKISAGWLIEACKLKGFSIGHAEIYRKQALILINKNNAATSKEVIQLARKIAYCVKQKFNITLESEVKIIH